MAGPSGTDVILHRRDKSPGGEVLLKVAVESTTWVFLFSNFLTIFG